MSAEELDKKVDEILSEAERERDNILKVARQKALEVLSRPIPASEYQLEASRIVEEARREASRIVEEAERLARSLLDSARSKMGQAINLIVEYVTGVKKE